MTEPASFEKRLEASPVTRTMWLLWLLSAGLIALDGFDFFVIGVALPFVQRDFGLGATSVGAVATAAIAGALVGSLTLGPITDRVGRQRMLLVDVAMFVIATAGTAIAWNAASLIAFRFLVGVGIGADYPISVSYITENVPARYRGRMVIGAFSFQAVGALLGALTGLTVLHLFSVIYPGTDQMAIQYAWRWMLGVGVLLAIAVAGVRLSFTPESPLYFISRGEYAEASKAATQLLETPVVITAQMEPQGTQARSQNQYRLLQPTARATSSFLLCLWHFRGSNNISLGFVNPSSAGQRTNSRRLGSIPHALRLQGWGAFFWSLLRWPSCLGQRSRLKALIFHRQLGAQLSSCTRTTAMGAESYCSW
ncbi:MAG: MFS transporter [Elainellaceae cyanobacterium]